MEQHTRCGYGPAVVIQLISFSAHCATAHDGSRLAADAVVSRNYVLCAVVCDSDGLLVVLVRAV